jgi:hypothetical protein
MDDRLLIKHKNAEKRLESSPSFRPARRGRLPKPLDKIGGGRVFASDLLPAGNAYHICFAWRDGELVTDTAFLAWLFIGKPGELSPIAVLHYHPSHKPVHLQTPCRDERDFTNRQLPGTTEFNISNERFDPRKEMDRNRLIAVFCERCGISLGKPGGLI